MRRALAAALLGISLWLGSLAWTGFLLTRTVLDPDRSRHVAGALYDDDAVRDRLAANIAGGVEAALPPGVPLERATIDAGAAQALESPAVEALFVDALVRTHRAMLGEGEVPREVDAGAFGSAGREALVEVRPELDGILPAEPQVSVPLPTERVPDLGPVRRGLLAAVPLLAVASGAGVALALLVTSDRPAVVRRAGVWAVGLSAVVLAFAYGVPALATVAAPNQSEVIAALVGAMAAETRVPAVALAALGVAAIAVSLVWRAAPAVLADPAPHARREVRTRRPPRLVGGPPPRRAPRDIPTPARRAPASPSPTAVHRAPDPAPTRVATSGGTTRQRARPPAGGSADVTRHQDVAPQAAGPTRWVAGVGWVVESPGRIPPDARWVPGVGYVVEEG